MRKICMLCKNIGLGCLILLCFILIMGCADSGDDTTTSNSDDNNTDSPDNSDTPHENDENSDLPKFSGFDLQLKEGDFWQYAFMYKKSSYSMSKKSKKEESGTFRVILGSEVEIEGITTYEVIIKGDTTVEDKDFAPTWKYLAASDNQLLGSKDGSSLVILFDAQEGKWPGGSFFFSYSSTPSLLIASTGKITNDYIDLDAVKVGRSDSQSQCEYFPNVGSICGDSSYNTKVYDYYAENVGPVGYSYYNTYSDCGGGYCSGATWDYKIGLVKSSLWGDATGPLTETEPNDSTMAAMAIDLFDVINGSVGTEESGSSLPAIAEDEPNEYPDAMPLDYLNCSIDGEICLGDDDSQISYFNPDDANDTYSLPEDVFSFTIDQASPVTIELEYIDGVQIFLDLYKDNGSGSGVQAEKIAPFGTDWKTRTIEEDLTAGDYLVTLQFQPIFDTCYDYTLRISKSKDMSLQDFYEFTLVNETVVTVNLNFEESNGDLDLYLLNGSATEVIHSSDACSGSDETITATLSKGDYFIGVKAVSQSSAQTVFDYTLSLE